MFRRLDAAIVTALAAILGVACGAERVPNFDINGVWSLNWIETRYPTSNVNASPIFYGDIWVETDPDVFFSTLYIEIENLGTSHEGGGSADVGHWSVGHGCALGWPAGTQSTTQERYAAGGYSRWLPEHPNTLLHEVGEEGEGPVGLMHCTLPSADQMRCRWGMPFEPAIRPEERDEVLVFDRGDGASAPVPCERVVERALIGPYLD
ncbi:MAG: hypothetical protein RL071_4595 [Pseudomonadota bacterium]